MGGFWAALVGAAVWDWEWVHESIIPAAGLFGRTGRK